MNAKRAMAVVFTGTLAFACAAKREAPAPSSAHGSAATTGVPSERRVETVPASGRMIARSAALRLVVAEPAGAIVTITNQAEARGGFVAESKLWQEAGQARGSLTLRVPTQALGSLLKDIKKGALRIETETVASQDVTAEYSDLSAQVANLEAAERELRTLLASVRERTQKASDVLEVFGQLTKVRSDIDRTRARITVLAKSVDLSTVTIDLVPDALVRPVVEPGWSAVPILRSASRALVSTLKSFAALVIWLVVYVLPVAALLVAVGIPIRSLIRRVRRRGFGASGT